MVQPGNRRRLGTQTSLGAAGNPLKDLRAEAKALRESIAGFERQVRDAKASLSEVEERILVLTTGSSELVAKQDTALRSLVKAIGWRLTAGLVTFSTSFYFTGGDWAVAGAIVGSDFISKSGTMYIGERLFNKVKAGKSASGAESPYRSIVKAIIWRLFAAVNTMVVSSFLVSKSASSGGAAAAAVGAKIAGADSVIKTCLMVAYDQMWSKIDWGREQENVGGLGI